MNIRLYIIVLVLVIVFAIFMQPRPQLQIQIEHESRPELQPQTEPKSQSGPQTQPQIEPKFQPEPQPQTQPRPQPHRSQYYIPLDPQQLIVVQRVVFAEAGYEPQKGREATAAVILNRINRQGFNKAIYTKNAFESVTKGTSLWKESENPSRFTGHRLSSWKACEVAVEASMRYRNPKMIAFRRYDCTGGQKYFGGLTFMGRIGNHNYYADGVKRKK